MDLFFVYILFSLFYIVLSCSPPASVGDIVTYTHWQGGAGLQNGVFTGLAGELLRLPGAACELRRGEEPQAG